MFWASSMKMVKMRLTRSGLALISVIRLLTASAKRTRVSWKMLPPEGQDDVLGTHLLVVFEQLDVVHPASAFDCFPKGSVTIAPSCPHHAGPRPTARGRAPSNGLMRRAYARKLPKSRAIPTDSP